MSERGEVDPGLVEVLAAHEQMSGHTNAKGESATFCKCGEFTKVNDKTTTYANLHAAHLARAVQAYTEQRADERVAEALEDAARAVRGLDYEHHTAFGSLFKHPTFVINEAAELLEGAAQATSGDLTSSTPDGGREGVRGGDGA